MGFFDKLKNIVQNVKKTGEAVGTQVYRKSKKPFRQYMAPERAQKAIDQHLIAPKRAPMNVPKIDFSKEKVQANKAAVQEMLKKSDEIIKKMEQMKIVSSDKDSGMESTRPKPQTRTAPSQQPAIEGEVPRGLMTVSDCVDLLHNYKLNCEEWSADELAAKFRLRTSDVENLVGSFKLLEPEDMKHRKTTEDENWY